MAEAHHDRRWRWLFVGLLAAALAAAGYWLLFTTFMLYDDEGYVLLSLRNFSTHGGLYDQVYTQYGPFPYVLYDALHRALPFDFTNVSGRWITLVNWLAAAGAATLLVGRVTRSVLWSSCVLALSFAYLWIMINEPIHPGGLGAALVAIGTWLGAESWIRGRIRGFGIATGLAAAALVLTKINVGALFALAVAVWLALESFGTPAARPVRWALAVAIVALPLVLMRALLDAPWIRTYALLFAGSALAQLLIAPPAAAPAAGRRAGWWFVASGAGATAVIAAIVLLRGSSLAGLVHGVFVEPQRHPGVYFFAMNWRVGSGTLALLSLAAAAWTAARVRALPAWFGETLAWTRVVAAVIFLATPLQIVPTSMAAWGMCYGVSLAWLFAWPLHPERPGVRVAAWVAIVLTFQFLQGYPVAGSQINWGTFLWVALLALGLWDAAPRLRVRCAAWSPWLAPLGAVAVATVTLVTAGELFRIGLSRFRSSEPLGLPGAATLRLPADVSADLRIVSENLRVHGDMLFSFPGMFSANLWSGLPAPTTANVTHWFSLLSAAQQQAIIDRLAAAPRAMLLVQRDLLDYLTRNRFSTTGPLRDWLLKQFHPVLRVDGYEVWARAGRRVAALSVARLTARAAEGEATLVLTVRAPAAAIAALEVRHLDSPAGSAVVGRVLADSLTVAPCDIAGDATAPAAPAVLPLRLPPLARVTLRARLDRPVDWSRVEVVLRDSRGERVGGARVVP